MGNLSIDPELVPGKVAAIRSTTDELKNCYNNILDINSLVKTNWTGAAAQSATNAIEQDSEILLNLINALYTISDQLEALGKQYAAADDASTVR